MAKATRDGDWAAAPFMAECAVAALAAGIDEARLFQFRNQIRYLRRQTSSKPHARPFAQA
jgi:hypothetical protein